MARLSDRISSGGSTSGSTGGSYGNSGGGSFSASHNRRPRRRRRNTTPGLAGGNKKDDTTTTTSTEPDTNPFNDPENAFESISGFLTDFGAGRADQRTSLQNTWLNKTISDAIDEFNGLTLNRSGAPYEGVVPREDLKLAQWLPSKWGLHPGRVLNDLWNRSTATERGVVPSQFRSSGRVIAY